MREQLDLRQSRDINDSGIAVAARIRRGSVDARSVVTFKRPQLHIESLQL